MGFIEPAKTGGGESVSLWGENITSNQVAKFTMPLQSNWVMCKPSDARKALDAG